MSARPKSFHFSFSKGGSLDPRLSFQRASAGTYPGGWSLRNGGEVGPFVEFPADTARTGSGAGLLLESGSANAVRNPRAEGASPGSPGVMPTNWAVEVGAGAAEVVAAGIQLGWPYVEIRLTGNPGGPVTIWFETETGIAAIPGDDWTVSLGVQQVAGDLSNITGMRLIQQGRDGSSGLNDQLGSSLEVNEIHKRFVDTKTHGEPSLAHVRPGLQVASSGGIDLTLRLFAPQLELSAFPTTPILPAMGAPAVSSRAADTLILPIKAGQVQGGLSVLTEFAHMAADPVRGRQNLWSVDDGTFSNILNVFVHETGGGRLRLQANGSGDAFSSLQWGNVPDRHDAARVVVSFSPEGGRVASPFGAVSVPAQDLSMFSAVSKLRLGSDPAGRGLNGYLKTLAVLPERLSDEVTEALAG